MDKAEISSNMKQVQLMLVIWDAQEFNFNVCARKKSVKKKSKSETLEAQILRSNIEKSIWFKSAQERWVF